MPLNALTHLNFAGNAREALEYYRSVFGGQVIIRTYAQSGVPHDEATADGTVIQNLAPSAMSPAYGMLTDRYGVTWIFGATS